MKLSLLLTSVLFLTLNAGAALRDSIEFCHPEAQLQDALYPAEFSMEPRSALEASAEAYVLLSDMGADDILICRAAWIAAPLGGYLIDGLFTLSIEGNDYSTFRIGIRDGTEDCSEDDPFVFIARNEADGEVLWFPEPGPDIPCGPGREDSVPLEYEYLIGREDFENLAVDFPAE